MGRFDKVNEILKNDGVIAFVTDTVWGLGCLPQSEKAVKKIYEIKHREAKKPLILMSNEVYNLFDYVKQPVEKEAQKTKFGWPILGSPPCGISKARTHPLNR